MGIIIINDTDSEANWGRRMETPEGDSEAYSKRITEYLQNIKSEATRASMWNGRAARNDARAAGLPPPPIDMTADLRAPVPEEMFPKLLVASNNIPFRDFEGGFAHGYIVSHAFREAVEVFDKDVHQFVPVEIRRKDGGLHEKRPFYFLRVTRLINAINFEASPELRPAGGGPREEVTETTPLLTHRNSFAVDAAKTAGMGLWLDRRSGHMIFTGQRLVAELTKQRIKGWSAFSSFVEI